MEDPLRHHRGREAARDLEPGLPRPIEVFVLAVVLTMWDLAAASAATAG